MGKGDKKSRRGKIVRGTSGVRRSKKKRSTTPVVETKITKQKRATTKSAKPTPKPEVAEPVVETAPAPAEAKEPKAESKKTTTKPKDEKKPAKKTASKSKKTDDEASE